MNSLLFLAPFSWGTQKREAAAPKASGCFMGGTCAVQEEPGKQKPRSCRAQELARSSAQENERQKKGTADRTPYKSFADESTGAIGKRGAVRGWSGFVKEPLLNGLTHHANHLAPVE